jgi:hypothetical protein
VTLKELSTVGNNYAPTEEHSLTVSENEVLRGISDLRKDNNRKKKKITQSGSS